MKKRCCACLAVVGLLLLTQDSFGRGFGRAGGARMGGIRVSGGSIGGYRGASFGGARVGGYGGYRSSSFGATRVGNYGGYRGSSLGATRVGSYGGYRGTSAIRGGYSGSYTGPRGTNIEVGGRGGAVRGPVGRTVGGGIRGAEVTTPNGRTATRISSGGFATGVGGRTVGTRRTGSTLYGPFGTAARGTRTTVGVGRLPTDAGLSRYTTRSVGAVRRSTYYVPRTTLTARGVTVRRNYANYGVFTPNWYLNHRAVWRARNWTALNAWSYATWPVIAGYCSYPLDPIYYDYGDNVAFTDNSVYVNGQSVGTPEQYAQQAETIAQTGSEAKVTDEGEWKSLGVFAMIQGDETNSNNVFQLAVNKDGIIRGNFYNALTDTTEAVQGSVDKKSQRAAWTIGAKKDTVFEAGIANLTRNQTTLLVHFGKDRTQQWTLVRVDRPADQK